MTFLQAQTILKALEFALTKGAFNASAKHKKAAQTLVKGMQSNKSVSGRHQQLVAMLRRGASIEQMMKLTESSRRTIFRYLNHFEDAGLNIQILDGKYKLVG